jgi:glycosyltransferase EpsF
MLRQENRKQLRVLHILDTMGVGGAETWMMALLRFWTVNSEIETHILVTSGKKGEFDEEAIRLGAKIHYVKFGLKRIPEFSRRFRYLLKSKRFDAIHDHQDFSSGWHFFLGAGLLPRLRITHVHNPSYQIQNNYRVSYRRRVTALLGKELVKRFATKITGTSLQVLDEYGLNAVRFRGIPKLAVHCAFDTQRFQGNHNLARQRICKEFRWPSSSRIVLFAGRIDHSADRTHPQCHKNSAFAIDVAILAAKLDPNFHMILAGRKTDAATQLQRQIDDAGLTGRIVFAGIRHDISDLMLGSHLLFFPSRGEGLGMVAVEAQACGLRVLASKNVPRECVVISDLINFKSLHDDDDAWAQTLIALSNRPRLAPDTSNTLVANSRFGIAQSSEQLLALYREANRQA